MLVIKYFKYYILYYDRFWSVFKNLRHLYVGNLFNKIQHKDLVFLKKYMQIKY